jgi:hypothetical protein
MDNVLEQFWILRSMRVMTGPAVHVRGLDIDMGFRERAPLQIMALAA